MNHGAIVQVGTPSEIYEFPATRFVADFIGSVNMFEGGLLERRRRRRAHRVRRARLHAARRGSTASSAAGATVWAAIRPEKINIGRQPPARTGGTAENAVHGTVHEIAYMGDMSIYLVRIASGRDGAGDAAERHAGRGAPADAWESVWLFWHGSSPVVLTELAARVRLQCSAPGGGWWRAMPDPVAAAALSRPLRDRAADLVRRRRLAIPPYTPLFELASRHTAPRAALGRPTSSCSPMRCT